MTDIAINRRELLKCGLVAGAALVVPAGMVSARTHYRVKFGLIADTHVSDKPDDSRTFSEEAGWTEYSTGSLKKLEAFSSRMNDNGVDFVATLGDLICSPMNTKVPYEQRRAQSFSFLEDAEARLALFKGPRYHVLGNHDTDQLAKEDVLAKITNTGISSDQTHYSFDSGGIHFLVLDANYRCDGTPFSGLPGSPGFGATWADAFIPQDQLSWIQHDLQATALPTIVLTHQLLNPLGQVDSDYEHELTIQNGDAVRSLLEQSGRILAVFAGHYHAGGYQLLNGIHYVTLQGNVAFGNDIASHNQYDTVEIYQNDASYSIIISGNGKCKSFALSSRIA